MRQRQGRFRAVTPAMAPAGGASTGGEGGPAEGSVAVQPASAGGALSAEDPLYQTLPSSLSVTQALASTRCPAASSTYSWQVVPTGMPVTFVSTSVPQPIQR